MSHPRVHVVWNYVLDELLTAKYSSPGAKEYAVSTFWNKVVDGTNLIGPIFGLPFSE